MTFMRMNRWNVLIAISLFLGSFFATGALASSDTHPPIVERQIPQKYELGVDPAVMISVYLVDPRFGEDPVSGIDFLSVQLRVNGDLIPIFVDDIGNHRVFVHSNCYSPMPENSWITASISAKDMAGNVMQEFQWNFHTGYLKDIDPPVLTNFSPPNGCTHIVPTAVVYCRAYDYGSGVDPSAVHMSIGGEPVSIRLIAIQDGYMVLFEHDEPFPYSSWIDVVVSVSDYDNNTATAGWTFQITPEPNQPPTLIHPEDNALLNYQLTQGVVQFQWVFTPGDLFYRLKLHLADAPAIEEIDLGPEDYTITDQLVRFDYPISVTNWDEIAEIGWIEWRVCLINHYGGSPVSRDSEEFQFALAPSEAVVLREPRNMSYFLPQTPSPEFLWDPFQGAMTYTLGIVRLNESGGFVGDVITREIDGGQNSFVFTQSEWKSIKSGTYVWAVVANLEQGQRSDFLNYYFEKLRRPLQSPIIHP